MMGRETETPSGAPRTLRPIAYRAGQPHIAGNKNQLKWDKAAYELHREKLKSAKATINTTSPMIYSHLVVKRKKIQMEQDRARRLKKENDANAEKLAQITRSRGRLDNWNHYEKSSLGERVRQLEQLRIAKENERILFNLSQCRSHYARKSYQEEWLKTLKVMDSIAQFRQDRTSQQKGQRNPVEWKVSTAVTTHNPARNKAKTRGKEEEEIQRDNVP